MFFRSSFVSSWRAVFSTLILTATVSHNSWGGQIYSQRPEIAPVAGKAPAPPDEKTINWNEGPTANWLWGDDLSKKYFIRKKVAGGAIRTALLKATCDNSMTVWINGQKVAASDNWNAPVEVDVTRFLKTGDAPIEIVAEVANEGTSPAGFVAKLVLLGKGNTPNRFIATDDSWEVAESRDAKAWGKVKVIAKLGAEPWGEIFDKPTGAEAGRDQFQVVDGFQVEKLFTVPKEELGSWVNITCDPKGRLIVSDQGNLGLCRVTPPTSGSDEETKVERLDLKIDDKPLSGAQGLLFAFDSLYVVCNGGPGSGLYRCRDTNGDDQFDEVVKLRDIPGGGEHGPHALRLSPDGKSIFIACGNHTKLPFEVKTNAPPQTMGGQRKEQLRAEVTGGLTSRLTPNWDEDLLLPRQWDGGGHAAGILAPGGWICRVDPEGKNWEVYSSGYRNQFDFAFNADGEIFAYDADMEWDYGSPWYRPTRVVHATSGSEFGWRSGTGKWPRYYADSLPEVVDIGPGCPVGVEFGYGAKFPAKYQKALFLCDWTFGTIYAAHIDADQSTYRGTKEEFLSRTPLPLTDCTIGKDGALYFTIGGRGAQSELFRVTYVGKEDTTPVDLKKSASGSSAAAKARLERKKIEELHVGEHKSVDVKSLVQSLGSTDPFLAYAARVALERRPLTEWQDLVFAAADKANREKNSAEKGVQTNIVSKGCIGLARQGEPTLLPKILEALGKLDIKNQTENEVLPILRAYQLALIRLGNPDPSTCEALGQKFEELFPNKSESVNRELAILMIHFQAPGTAKKLIPLLTKERVATQGELGDLLKRNPGYGSVITAMLANQPDLQQYHYAFHLRNLKKGWTLDERKTYFDWFNKAQKWSGGASYPKFLVNIDNEAFANCTDTERLAVEASGVRKPFAPPELPAPAGPGKDYKIDDVLTLTQSKLTGRDFKNGETMFRAGRCVLCHRFGGTGGATGPDLTQLAGRFNIKELTEAIIEPSKVISDQFKASIVVTQGGKIITGQVVADTKDAITVVVDPENATKTVVIQKSDIDTQELSSVSLMPKDLLKQMNPDEVLDLMAYLLSRGNPQDAMFRK